MKNRIANAFNSVSASDDLKQNTAEKMLRVRKCKRPVLKYAVTFILIFFFAAGYTLFPKQGNKADNLSFVVYASDGGNHKEIPLFKEAMQITSMSDSGKTMKGFDLIDFNLRCTGRPDIKRVTYTANNCEFMKKTFCTKDIDGGILMDETQVDGTVTSWGYAPIGHVYSADFLEEVNLKNFCLKITYADENAHETKPLSKEELAAYKKASISAEVEMQDGTKITEKIKISVELKKGHKTVTAYLED